jgi:hypothetical protein
MDEDELEPEVLTYQEFKKRQTLLAWRRRWRAHELKQDEERAWDDAPQRAQNRYRGEGSAPAAEA